jgi:predicted N-formylglutamate amidohydrolase
VLIAVHSFTPSLLGADRPWHVGILYRDRRLAAPVLQRLRQETDLVVGDNEPYAAGELTDFTIVEHGERRGIAHVEVEIRQDLIREPAGQAEWAERFARVLREATAGFPG